MAETTAQRLRGLFLSAVELRALTDWREEVIEDYLNLLDNLITLSNEIDTKNNILKETTTVTTTPYTPLSTDEEIFVNTDASNIDISLPPGIGGTNYRIINTGSSGNVVNLIPALTDKLIGLNEPDYLADREALIITFEETEGWW